MRAYVSLHTLRDEDKLATWLCGIARNVVRRFFRSSATHRRIETVEAAAGMIEDQRGAPDKHLLNKEINEAVRAALMQLGEDKRVVFTLKVLQGRSYEEIAQITGFSVPKLKTDLHRAKIEMRRVLRPYLEVKK